jgi:orotate phosphoribosyltransferase
MADARWVPQLYEMGADLNGHFVLDTGQHSPRFFQMARIGERPEILREWSLALYRLLAPYGVKTFVGAAVGGMIPTYALAQAAEPGSRALFAEPTERGELELYPGALAPDEPVIVIEDAVATGASTRRLIRAVQSAGGRPVAAGAYVDRGFPIAWEVPFHAVVRLPEPVPMWDPAECPLCAQHIPLTMPKGI